MYVSMFVSLVVVVSCVSSQDSVAGTRWRENHGTGCLHGQSIPVDGIRKGTSITVAAAALSFVGVLVSVCNQPLRPTQPPTLISRTYL